MGDEAAKKEPRKPLTIAGQARFVDGLVGRTIMHGGKVPDEAYMLLTRDEIDHLTELSNRLHRLAPFEDRIRSVVMAK